MGKRRGRRNRQHQNDLVRKTKNPRREGEKERKNRLILEAAIELDLPTRAWHGSLIEKHGTTDAAAENEHLTSNALQWACVDHEPVAGAKSKSAQ